MPSRARTESGHVRRRGGEEAIDPISLLPDSILITILSLLPLAEAAKTSILSNRWRYLWSSIPDLDLFSFFLETYSQDDYSDQKEVQKYISIFYLIFSLRRDPVYHCHLPLFNFNGSSFHTDNFLLFLRKLRTQELVLRNMGSSSANTLSPKLFLFQSLKNLVIGDFCVLLPSQFKDLTNLQSLKLCQATITNSQLQILVSHCPNLENLSLSGCVSLCDLRICAPNLLSLNILMHTPTCFSLINAPRLNHFSLSYIFRIEVEEEEADDREKDETAKLIKILMNLDHIESFSLTCYPQGFKYTSIMRLPDSLHAGHQLVHLKELSMVLDFDNAKTVSLLLFLLRYCPNLQKLGLEARIMEFGFPIEIDFWDKQKSPECLINHLMMVDMSEVSLSSYSVIEFVKFFLLNACVLIRMTLNYITTPRGKMEEEETVNELLLFKSASPQVQLEIKPYVDEEC